MQMPRDKESVLSASIDFPQLVERNLIEKVVRKWVAAKIKQLLGVEEQAMINLVCVHLRTMQATPETMLKKVGGILDEDADDFVYKLWQVLLFEHMKVQGGVYQS